jgi:hypothetical protein
MPPNANNYRLSLFKVTLIEILSKLMKPRMKTVSFLGALLVSFLN